MHVSAVGRTSVVGPPNKTLRVFIAREVPLFALQLTLHEKGAAGARLPLLDLLAQLLEEGRQLALHAPLKLLLAEARCGGAARQQARGICTAIQPVGEQHTWQM